MSLLCAAFALAGCGSSNSPTSSTDAGTEAAACPTGQLACSGGCVDSQIDPANCGACGNACAAGQVCSGGQCSSTCAGGQTECTPEGGAPYCANTDADNANCGACGNACGAGQVCSGGQCSSTCASGQTECTPEGGAPYCASTDTDNANCGACGTTCTAHQQCVNGSCQDVVCSSDSDCDDGLYCDGTETCDPTSSSANSFGCVAGTSPCLKGYCNEASRSCCTLDADKDGLISALCGGPDCDDDVAGFGLGDWSDCGTCGNQCAAQQACLGSTCVDARRVFLSSATYTGNLGGLAGADNDCQTLADSAGLGGTWKAFMIDHTHDLNRLTVASVPYVRLDGVEVAKTWADLSDGSIEAPIDITEQRTLAGGDTWTGTIAGLSSTYDCNSWTSASSSSLGIGGESQKVDGHWEGYYSYYCNSQFRIYCIEQ